MIQQIYLSEKTSSGGKFNLQNEYISSLNSQRAKLLYNAFDLCYHSRCLSYTEIKSMTLNERNTLIDRLTEIREEEKKEFDKSTKKK